MKPLLILIVGVAMLWASPRTEAVTTPQVQHAEAGRSVSSSSRCKTGYRKSTLTGRCVRSGNRYFLLGWN